MIKTRIIKVKGIEKKQIIIPITIMKIIIWTVIMTTAIIIIMRVKIGELINVLKR